MINAKRVKEDGRMPKECPRCEGKGFIVVKNPHYKLGSLSLYLKRKTCPHCDGRGVIYACLS